MSIPQFMRLAFTACTICLATSACFHPPYNNFEPDNRAIKQVGSHTALSAGAGALAGAAIGSGGVGAVIGGAAGAARGMYKTSKPALIADLKKQDIEFIEYGDTMTLIIPTDRFYVFDTPHLNDICYAGLNNAVKLIKLYPHAPVYVAGFTDNVGTKFHKKQLSQARAETMLTFLWANGIQAKRLQAEAPP
jgi:outer membrane protein OmpA-like peptidoglycan-associated protein